MHGPITGNGVTWGLAVALAKVLGRRAFRGKYRLAGALGSSLAWAGLEELPATPGRGWWLTVPARDRIGRLMWLGCYEPELTRLLARLVQPGWTVLDVGAHVGWFTVLFAGLVGSGGLVVAFEPDPENLVLLRRNVSHLAQVRIHEFAVADVAGGAVTFWRSPRAEESGWGSLLPDGEPRDAVPVPVTTIDNYVAEHGLARVDLMKLDTEGAELRILTGAANTLESLRPIVVAEANAGCLARHGATPADLKAGLQNHRYLVGRLRRSRAEPDTIVALPAERPDTASSVDPLVVWT